MATRRSSAHASMNLSVSCADANASRISAVKVGADFSHTAPVRCCFSEVPNGECVIVKDAGVHSSCKFPFEHPRNEWFLRILDTHAPTVHLERSGKLTYYSDDLARSLQSLQTCTNIPVQMRVVNKTRVDHAIAISFFGGAAVVLLVVLIARRCSPFFSLKRYRKMKNAESVEL